MKRWISVKTRLPKDDDAVLVRDGGEIKMASCNRYSREWWRDGIMQQLCSVTHWMPLPDTPEKA